MRMNAIETAIENTNREGEQSRLTMMRENWEAYYGRGKRPLKVEEGGVDDNACNNYAKVIVDKGVAFLFGKEIQFDIEEGNKTPEEEWLDACWQASGKMSLLQKLALAGGVCGTAFIRIHYTPGMEYPKLYLVDPETVSIVSEDDDVEAVNRYIETYTFMKKVDGTNRSVSIRRVYKKAGAQWVIEEQRSQGGRDFETTATYAWPYDFAPIVHCQNLAQPFQVWGEPDLNDSLKEAILTNDFIWSNTRKILRHHAHPKTIATGIQADKITNRVDGLMVLEAPGADIRNLEMQSDLVSSLEYSRRQIEFIHELSRVPEIATGKVENVGQLSGIALEILYQPLLEKTAAKRITYGEMITELNRRLLTIGGKGTNVYPKIVWQELLPKDVSVVANAALVKNQLGVSLESLQRELNYDPDKELPRWRDEQSNLGGKLLADLDRGGIDEEA